LREFCQKRAKVIFDKISILQKFFGGFSRKIVKSSQGIARIITNSRTMTPIGRWRRFAKDDPAKSHNIQRAKNRGFVEHERNSLAHPEL
jgi:hypothetical protein